MKIESELSCSAKRQREKGTSANSKISMRGKGESPYLFYVLRKKLDYAMVLSHNIDIDEGAGVKECRRE